MPLIKFVMVKDEEDEHFIMNWMEELGWGEDPFKPQVPEPVANYISGLKDQQSKLNIFVVNNQPFGTIHGGPGSGKTLLMRWVRARLERFKSKIYPVYIQQEHLSKDIYFIQALIKPTLGFFEKLFGKKKWAFLDGNTLIPFLRKKLWKKRMLVLIDDVGHAEKPVINTINKLLDSDLPIQFIVADQKKGIEKAHLHYHKDHLKIDMGKPSFELLRGMIKRRIEAVGGDDILPFTDTLLKKIIAKAKHNPAEMLKICSAMAVKSTIVHKRKGKKTELAPPTPREESSLKKYDEEKHEEIKKKISTINYIKGNKKKPKVDVIENKTKSPSEDEYVDLDEKEKNDKLISELFDDD